MIDREEESRLEKFIARVGFPIVAFLLMAYMCFITISENTKALQILAQKVEILCQKK